MKAIVVMWVRPIKLYTKDSIYKRKAVRTCPISFKVFQVGQRDNKQFFLACRSMPSKIGGAKQPSQVKYFKMFTYKYLSKKKN